MTNLKTTYKIALIAIATSLSTPAWAVFPITMAIQNAQLLGNGAVMEITNTVTCGDPGRFSLVSGSIYVNSSAFQRQGGKVVSGGGSNYLDSSSVCDETSHEVKVAVPGYTFKNGKRSSALWKKTLTAIISDLSSYICFTEISTGNSICESPSVSVSTNVTP